MHNRRIKRISFIKRNTGKGIAVAASTLLLSACQLPGLSGGAEGGEGIQIMNEPYTETQIMGYMIAGTVEHYMDVEPEVINNLGTSTMVHDAMVSGAGNISSTRYTGTTLTGELGQEPSTDPEEALHQVETILDEEYDQKWFDSFGFENTYAFLVREETAEEYGLETVSDLEDIADELVLGSDNSWIERAGDGYAAFVETYGFEFDNLYPMQIGLVYDALAEEDMDIVLGYSTDGRIASYDLVTLEDDKNVFPPYDASPSATHEILEEYPELEQVMQKMAGILDVETMQELNYIADNNLLEPAIVAEEFLEANNYFEENEPYLEPVAQEES